MQQRYASVLDRVVKAAQRAGRRGEDVILAAVTKYAEPQAIHELMALGHQDFGESRVLQLVQRACMIQEYLQRRRALPESLRDQIFGGAADEESRQLLAPYNGMCGRTDDGSCPRSIRWHMIGHLQRNKARKVVEFSRLIHSVDSLRLAEELQEVGLKQERTIDVLVQVNIAGENQKFGCPLPAIGALIEQIDTMAYMRVRGLMTMAPLSENPEDSRSVFSICQEVFSDVAKEGAVDESFQILSMGMSNDFEVAIECGANLVRVGSAIFGDAPTDNSEEVD